LRDFSHLLCPECKKKVLKYIMEEDKWAKKSIY
jgi:uncharacterized protein YbaR (Trm112 family)